MHAARSHPPLLLCPPPRATVGENPALRAPAPPGRGWSDHPPLLALVRPAPLPRCSLPSAAYEIALTDESLDEAFTMGAPVLHLPAPALAIYWIPRFPLWQALQWERGNVC